MYPTLTVVRQHDLLDLLHYDLLISSPIVGHKQEDVLEERTVYIFLLDDAHSQLQERTYHVTSSEVVIQLTLVVQSIVVYGL